MKQVYILNKEEFQGKDGEQKYKYYILLDFWNEEKKKHDVSWRVITSDIDHELHEKISIEYDREYKRWRIIE